MSWRRQFTNVAPDAGRNLAVDRGLIASGPGATASQGLLGAIKVFGAAGQGLVRPLQLFVRVLLDRRRKFVQAPGTLVESPFSRVEECFPFIGSPFTLVRKLFSTIGEFLAAVSRGVPLIGKLFAAVSRTVALIGRCIPAVRRAVLYLPRPHSFRRALPGSVHIR